VISVKIMGRTNVYRQEGFFNSFGGERTELSPYDVKRLFLTKSWSKQTDP
jgi:hypothetical protein